MAFKRIGAAERWHSNWRAPSRK